MFDKQSICRPERLTERWVQEITDAIRHVCLTAPRLSARPTQPESAWKDYVAQLQTHPCSQDPQVQAILSYEIDYRSVYDRR